MIKFISLLYIYIYNGKNNYYNNSNFIFYELL